MARMAVLAIMLLWSLGTSATAHAFGADGHRITGYIAEAELSDEARVQLRALLGTYDLAQIALQADERRAELAQRLPGSERWHYDDRLACHPDLPVRDYCPGGQCASAAIARWRDVLADTRAPREDRVLAVLLLVHIIGDIHQPLHAADNNDRGGNAVRVRLPDARGSESLHAAWDVAFVRLAMDGLTPRAAAQAWRARYAHELAAWRTGTVESWMEESYALAAQVTYGELPEWNCDSPSGATLSLSSAYVEHATALMPAQLTRAGVRIAAVLNAALAPRPPSH